jgi:pilus assembly protein CpaC
MRRNTLPALLAAFFLIAAAPLCAQGSAEEIKVSLGKSVVIDYPEDVNRISTSNPEIVDYVPISTREILLHAKGAGVATLVIWSKSGQRNFYNISVEPNLEPVRKMLKDSFPSEEFQLMASKDSVVLMGLASNQAVADRALALVSPLAKNVVNNLRVKPAPVEKQILLRVKFAELNRTFGQQFAVNLLSTGAANTPGLITTGQFQSATPQNLRGTIGAPSEGTSSNFTIADALNIFAFRPDLNLAAFVKLLQTQGLLQILAEPNLVTSNGKEASFLVGGEFPVPVLQGGGNAGAVTIQFREFGIRLSFNPQLTENNTLKMAVKPEVSTIDLANAVSFQGFTIPALATRRIESNIELGFGQSFVIGGLIDDRTNESLSQIPGLSAIPILGELFKSRNQSRNKTELLVMVTPEVVEPFLATDPKNQLTVPKDTMTPILLPNGIPGQPASPKVKVTPMSNKQITEKSGKAEQKKQQ